MLSEFYGKKYKLDLEASKNFEEYMKALGVGFFLRKIGNTTRPVIELIEEPDGRLTLSSKSSFKNMSFTFRLGEEFEQETADGRKVKSVITLDGNTLTEIQKNGKECKIVREFGKDKVAMTLTVDDVVCTRIYNALTAEED